VKVAGEMVTATSVGDTTVTLTAAGAPGTLGLIPKEREVVPVVVSPPATVVVAVIVNVVAEIAIVGVPEITPVAVSSVSPAGSGPVIEYLVPVGEAAEIDALIGVIAAPTVPLAVDDVSVTSSGVVNLVAVEVAPSPLLFAAAVTTE
jgi:hypothetical protein